MATVFALAMTAFEVHSATWSDKKKVEKINIGGNKLHGSFVKLIDYSFAGCSSSVAFLDGDSNPNYKEIISTLLAAKMADREVNIRVDGCGGNGNNYPLIDEMQIY